ncbi:hypothetical protein FVW20_12025 [Desulfovibrio oxamicus]|uniref:Uncharacterized protein n=1 Tax=Nitratidesulfovibrio oxamicus TaxID=32016 RepID=A0ABS0J5I1_9BACT|nr:hypothetical protein [Nitratidesulfovibrio oxamicus]MBG3877720.1 hypothetical protein [Nitratidesulfovibrio oxamicus]
MIRGLILGGLFVLLIYLLLRYVWRTRPENPREVLREELSRRRAVGESAAGMSERLRDVASERLRPVAAALAEMREELPEDQRFDLRDAGDTLTVEVGGRTIVVTHNALTVLLGDRDGSGHPGGDGARRPLRDERYGIRVDGALEEHPDLAATVRRLASLIADAVAGRPVA